MMKAALKSENCAYFETQITFGWYYTLVKIQCRQPDFSSLSLSFFGLVSLICVYLSLWEMLDLFQEPVATLPVHKAVMSATGP